MRVNVLFLPIITVFFSVVFQSGFTQTQTVAGEVSGSWSSDTIMVVDHILVADGYQLNISPGVHVIFDGHYRFDILGSVRANGVQGDSVIFTVSDTTSFSNPQVDRGGWHGIRFNNTMPGNDSSVFSHCKFTFGKAIGDSLGNFGGAIFIRNFGRVRLSNCLISNNYAQNRGGGISGSGALVKIENCRIENNMAGFDQTAGIGGGIYFDNSAPTIISTVIHDNYAYVAGGGISFWFTDPVLVNCIVSDNYGAFGGGMNFFYCGNTHPVSGNLIFGNHSYFFGGGMTCNGTHHVMVNNTMVNNFGGGGGAIFLNTSSFPTYINNVFWGNFSPAGGNQIYIWDVFSAPNFYFNDMEGGKEDFGGTGGVGSFIGNYEDNIESDPLFAGSGEYIYSLSENSPCINAGKPDTAGFFLPDLDITGNPRIDGGRIDMGACEFQGTANINTHEYVRNSVKIYPNPFSDKANIKFACNRQSATEVCISDVSGRLVKSWKLSDNELPDVSVTWDGRSMNGTLVKSGLYLVTFKTVDSQFSQPLIFYQP